MTLRALLRLAAAARRALVDLAVEALASVDVPEPYVAAREVCGPAVAKCDPAEAAKVGDAAVLEDTIANLYAIYAVGMSVPRCCRCGSKTMGGTMDDGFGRVVDIVIACANQECDSLTERVTYEEPMEEDLAVFIARCKAQFGEML